MKRAKSEIDTNGLEEHLGKAFFDYIKELVKEHLKQEFLPKLEEGEHYKKLVNEALNDRDSTITLCDTCSKLVTYERSGFCELCQHSSCDPCRSKHERYDFYCGQCYEDFGCIECVKNYLLVEHVHEFQEIPCHSCQVLFARDELRRCEKHNDCLYLVCQNCHDDVK